MICLWCNGPEPCRHYRPGKDVDFICFSCIQLLLGYSQEKLRELQKQCEAKGYDQKVEALKSFMEVGYEQRNPKRDTPKRTYRKRFMRASRNEQKSNWKFTPGEVPSLRKIEQRESAIR